MNALSFRARLYAGVCLLFAVVLISMLLVLLQQAEKDLVRELHASRSMVLQLFDSLSRSATAPDAMRLDGLRHLRIIDLNPASDATPPAAAPGAVPAWLARWLAPAVTERFPPLTLSFADGQQWRITPDAHDELEEIWESVQLLLLVFAMALLLSLLTIHWALSRGLGAYHRLLDALQSVAGGQLRTRLGPSQQPEINRLAERFNGMAAALQRAEQRNQELTERLLSVQERERMQLAHALHDDLGQYLTGIRAQAFLLQRCDHSDSRTLTRLSSQLLSNCDGLQQGFRRLVRDLHPVVLERLGLEQALAQLTEQWQQQQGVECRLELDGQLPGLRLEARAHLYRLLQEALNNVARHARARCVWVRLSQEQDLLLVSVQDDGSGMATPVQWGIGMHSMRERARCLGSPLQVNSAAGEGVVLGLRIPLRAVA
ncbi:sensor histidine kinase [Halopseudomonas sabulinigri]|uniref:histidine kinase n=1 Tax=Halopseudomonas sabulinigri TaxID=472181 RepID=A0ABP9ZQI7_9GAMM